MTTPRLWHLDDNSKLIIHLDLIEFYAIIESVKTVCYDLDPGDIENRIGRTQQELETLLAELIAIEDSIHPQPVDDPTSNDE